MSDLNRYLAPHSATRGYYSYRFPNGRAASVIPDTATPLHWELLDFGATCEERGLTTEQVQARLAEVMALPRKED